MAFSSKNDLVFIIVPYNLYTVFQEKLVGYGGLKNLEIKTLVAFSFLTRCRK